ncbi:MAG: alpha-rhamnosidase [Bacteroidales bacterium]|nr:alpha-rhamnosidase [Bacteroidales bacterium]
MCYVSAVYSAPALSRNEPAGAVWIHYPGDYEIWLGNEMQNRRTERGAFYPPFWKMDSHYVLVDFLKTVELSQAEEIEIYAEGRYTVRMDGRYLYDVRGKMTVPAGTHTLVIKVHHQAAPPSILVRGKTIRTDATWQVTIADNQWTDESGRPYDVSSAASRHPNAAASAFDDPTVLPSQYRMATMPQRAVHSEEKGKGLLVDFGRETFGYVCFHRLKGHGELNIYYGESPEEALATATCETLDRIPVDHSTPRTLTLDDSRAFRYLYIEQDPGLAFDSVTMLYEYRPLEYRGNFRCNDELINRIWDMAAYTLHLTTREFFIDGIKRDRWVWSGDACQSYLMNYYLFFDTDVTTATILTLRGKNPVINHINTIMDYTFYWFISIYDYYLYTGDADFIRQYYPRMKTLMDFCLSRRNANGMMEGYPGDWLFIDWADFPMSKEGELSFEQLLFCRSLETMAVFARLAHDDSQAVIYEQAVEKLKPALFSAFWSEEKKAFVHNRLNGIPSQQVTPYTNIFAVLMDYLDASQAQTVKQRVLMNPDALKITTPYMRFYELEAWCKLGEYTSVLKEIRNYWGGMLKLGATSFWEKYNPSETGTEHLAMYGRPFGKSLCHAWGASPVYLLGKYYLGVKPEKEGYKEFSIRPKLGDLQWIQGNVPTPEGDIQVYMDHKQIKVKAGEGKGTLYFNSRTKPKTDKGTVEPDGTGYRLTIVAGEEYSVKGSF